MKKTCRWILSSTLTTLILATLFTAPALAVCTPTLSSVDDIAVSLMSADSDEIHRREFAEISDDLASALGITSGDIAGDDEAPNPQIRVRLQSVPFGSDISTNNAVFTVVAIRTVAGTDKQLWVYSRLNGSDKDAGEFKLFVKTNSTVYATADSDSDGKLDDIVARAFTVPVSSLAYTDSGGTTNTTYYCEPASAQSHLEKATRKADDRVVVLAPHGGNTETATSSQASRFATTLESLNSVPVNIWNLEGKWGNNQTFERWHITATSIDTASYPGLAALLPTDGDFDRAIAFHGFGGSTSALTCSSGPYSGINRLMYQIILGGGATRNLKCAIAKSIDDALVTAGRTDDIAISIRDSAGNIQIADTCGRTVSQSGLDGTHADNIVNRLASLGGIQLEQSKTLRDDATLPNLVADAVADGLADYLADSVTNYCSGL